MQSLTFHAPMLLSVFIASNDSLEVLDLAWNHLRGKGAMAVAAGLGVCLFVCLFVCVCVCVCVQRERGVAFSALP